LQGRVVKSNRAAFGRHSQSEGQALWISGAIAKNFSREGMLYNPPCPPSEKGGTTRNCWASPSLKKGDLGGFENLQGERIFSKSYKK
jgi:hypothetical protein